LIWAPGFEPGAAGSSVFRFAKTKDDDSEHDGPIGTHEYRSAGCQQVQAHPATIDDRYFGGRVAYTDNDDPDEPSPCDCPLVNRPFDPKNFQIAKVPVLYIESSTDVNTPIECARYHMKSQTQTENKALISPVDMAHAELDFKLKSCGNMIWNAALAGSLDTITGQSQAIETGSCPAGDAVETANLPESSSTGR